MRPGPPKALWDFEGLKHSAGVFGGMLVSPSGLKEGMMTQNSGRESQEAAMLAGRPLLCTLIFQRGLGILKRSEKFCVLK